MRIGATAFCKDVVIRISMWMGVYLLRNWDGEFGNIVILIAIAIDEDGYREVLGDAEG